MSRRRTFKSFPEGNAQNVFYGWFTRTTVAKLMFRDNRLVLQTIIVRDSNLRVCV